MISPPVSRMTAASYSLKTLVAGPGEPGPVMVSTRGGPPTAVPVIVTSIGDGIVGQSPMCVKHCHLSVRVADAVRGLNEIGSTGMICG